MASPSSAPAMANNYTPRDLTDHLLIPTSSSAKRVVASDKKQSDEKQWSHFSSLKQHRVSSLKQHAESTLRRMNRLWAQDLRWDQRERLAEVKRRWDRLRAVLARRTLQVRGQVGLSSDLLFNERLVVDEATLLAPGQPEKMARGFVRSLGERVLEAWLRRCAEALQLGGGGASNTGAAGGSAAEEGVVHAIPKRISTVCPLSDGRPPSCARMVRLEVFREDLGTQPKLVHSDSGEWTRFLGQYAVGAIECFLANEDGVLHPRLRLVLEHEYEVESGNYEDWFDMVDEDWFDMERDATIRHFGSVRTRRVILEQTQLSFEIGEVSADPGGRRITSVGNPMLRATMCGVGMGLAG